MNDLSNIAGQLSAASAELAASNFEAKQKEAAKMIDAMHKFADEYGLCNAVGMLADYAEKKSWSLPEGSPESEDYELARQVLEGAAAGVDLTYGTSPARFRESRAQAVGAVVELARGIAP